MLYERATKKHPQNEEFLSHLMMAYVRVGEYKRQNQTAMQLYKLRPAKNPYYFWSVMSTVMQVSHFHSPPPPFPSLYGSFLRPTKIRNSHEPCIYHWPNVWSKNSSNPINSTPKRVSKNFPNFSDLPPPRLIFFLQKSSCTCLFWKCKKSIRKPWPFFKAIWLRDSSNACGKRIRKSSNFWRNLDDGEKFSIFAKLAWLKGEAAILISSQFLNLSPF